MPVKKNNLIKKQVTSNEEKTINSRLKIKKKIKKIKKKPKKKNWKKNKKEKNQNFPRRYTSRREHDQGSNGVCGKVAWTNRGTIFGCRSNTEEHEDHHQRRFSKALSLFQMRQVLHEQEHPEPSPARRVRQIAAVSLPLLSEGFQATFELSTSHLDRPWGTQILKKNSKQG